MAIIYIVKFFQSSIQLGYVDYTHKNCLNEVILMSVQYIQGHVEMRKFP